MIQMYLQQKRAKIHTSPSELGELKGEIDIAGNVSLKFTPDDPNNNDYDIKILKTSNLTQISLVLELNP